jgi:hypothetical protein
VVRFNYYVRILSRMRDVPEASNPHTHVAHPLPFEIIHEILQCRELDLEFLELLLRMRNNIQALLPVSSVHYVCNPFENCDT